MMDESSWTVRLSHRVRLPVLGLTTTFATDSADVLSGIVDLYGGWSDLPPSAIVDSPVTVRIHTDAELGADGGADLASVTPRYRVPDPSRLLVHARDAFGTADTVRREAVAYVNPAIARNRHALEGIIEPLTLFLLGPHDRLPLHAAAVVRDGVALLLAGPSGTGKSTLAYAASKAGFRTLADEPVYLQRHPVRVWGRRARLHLPIESRHHFPELGDAEPELLPTGKQKIVIREATDSPRFAERVGLCLLRRDENAPPGLEPMRITQAVQELTSQLDPGYDLFADQVGDAIERVSGRAAWSLTWSGGPRQAVRYLHEAAAALSAT